MNWRTDMGFDADVIRLIEVSSYLMKNYLSCDDPDGLIDSYFDVRRGRLIEDVEYDLYRRMPWGVACAIYYTQVLGGDLTFVGKWETENGLSRPPEEVIKYINKHWFRISED